MPREKKEEEDGGLLLNVDVGSAGEENDQAKQQVENDEVNCVLHVKAILSL